MTEHFQVSFLNDEGERHWTIRATNPDTALDQVIDLNDSAEGIYSVWDPQDQFGMPLTERQINQGSQMTKAQSELS